MFRTRMARSEPFKAREVVRPSAPRRIVPTVSPGRPPVVTCTPVATETFTKTPGPVGTSTSMGPGPPSIARRRTRETARKTTAPAERIARRSMSAVPVDREPVPALATWIAIFKTGNAGEQAASATAISSARAAAAAVSQAVEEGAGGDVKIVTKVRKRSHNSDKR